MSLLVMIHNQTMTITRKTIAFRNDLHFSGSRPKKAALLFCLLVVILQFVPPMAARAGNPSTTVLDAPTDPRDLVVFIAKYKQNLYRLVGNEPVAYGTAQFYNPVSIVADPRKNGFYVLDRPKLITENIKIWCIAANGTPNIVYQAPSTTQGGPFGKPTSLGLDQAGRVLIADAATGLWRLERSGQLQRLFDGKDKPLYKITAAIGTLARGLVIGTSYMYEITGGQMLNLPHQRGRMETWSASPSHVNEALTAFYPVNPGLIGFDHTGVDNSTGRQVPIRIWKNQGGVYLLDLSTDTPEIAGIIPNCLPGHPEYETFWRTLSQMFLDTADRLVLVDSGSKKTFEEKSYGTSYSRKSESVINGGIFILHPDGRLEEITYKTPDHSSGPLRRPAGAAQWSTNTYIVADPELYVPGINGTGGLLLLNTDGTRQPRWPFGYRIQPCGVAVLRAAGTPVHAVPTRTLSLSDLVGIHTAGPITRIENISWEKQTGGYPPGHALYGFGQSWQPQSPSQAAAHLRSLFTGARWDIAADGSFHFSARGHSLHQQGTPLVMQGTVTADRQLTNALADYKGKNLFDTQLGSLEARLQSTAPGTVTANVAVTVFTKNERLKATFVQTLE